MDEIREPVAATEWSASIRRKGLSIGFVPTMGALHQGHLELVRRAKDECDRVACSIFVNPLQFNDPEDLAKYPTRPLEDREMLAATGCDALFAPVKEELFHGFQPREYDLGRLDAHWEGPSRPGHFQGVVNVVERLFHFIRPDSAYFGEKDRQQLTILQWIQQRQRWPERIVACPTVREADGLALSSRNLRLNARERAAAPALHRALSHMAASAFKESVQDCIDAGAEAIRCEPLFETNYLGVADSSNLAPITEWGDRREAVALVAARLGTVRLIDNITLIRQ